MSKEIDVTRKNDLLARFSPEFSDFVDLGQQIGSNHLDAVLTVLGGSKVHVPQTKQFWRKLAVHVRDEEIRAKFTGFNTQELAAEYGLCNRQLRRIVNQ